MDLTEFFFTYVWPAVIILAECVLLLVFLLVAVAYVIYADRKIWAAVQMRRGGQPTLLSDCDWLRGIDRIGRQVSGPPCP